VTDLQRDNQNLSALRISTIAAFGRLIELAETLAEGRLSGL
jgi:hypothetical protein